LNENDINLPFAIDKKTSNDEMGCDLTHSTVVENFAAYTNTF